MTLSDNAFLRSFQLHQLQSLSHLDHVQLAYLTLKEEPLLSAIDSLRRGFRAIAESKGRPDIFNETITWAFTILINERIERGLGHAHWDEFVESNSDLCRGIVALEQHYSRATLESDLARRTFIFPDLLNRADTKK